MNNVHLFSLVSGRLDVRSTGRPDRLVERPALQPDLPWRWRSSTIVDDPPQSSTIGLTENFRLKIFWLKHFLVDTFFGQKSFSRKIIWLKKKSAGNIFERKAFLVWRKIVRKNLAGNIFGWHSFRSTKFSVEYFFGRKTKRANQCFGRKSFQWICFLEKLSATKTRNTRKFDFGPKSFRSTKFRPTKCLNQKFFRSKNKSSENLFNNCNWSPVYWGRSYWGRDDFSSSWGNLQWNVLQRSK